MSDSENWSSFEETDPHVKKKQPLPQRKAEDDTEVEAPVGPSLDLRQLRNRLVFGGLVGFTTGATFGTIDGVKAYSKKHGKMALQGVNSVARSAAFTGGLFSVFFCSYQGVKTVMELQRGKEDFINVGVSTLVAGLPLIRVPAVRQNLPFGLMLVGMDYFHEEIDKIRNS